MMTRVKTYKKFQPVSLLVDEKVKFLLDSGGDIVRDKQDHLVIERHSMYARVDSYGRVSWSREMCDQGY